MMILFLIPVFQILIFGYVIKNEVKDAKVGVLDLSGDVMTAGIVSKLDAANDIEIVKTFYNYEEIESAFRSNEIKAAIVFESDFANNFTKEKNANMQILLDASDPNLANLLNSYISAISANYAREHNSAQSVINVSIEPRMLYNENLVSAYMFVPGTMEILLVSPLRPIQIVLGKLAPYAILSVINAISIILIGNLIFGVPVLGSPLVLLLVSFVFILMALSLGLLISNIAKTQQVAMFISMFGLLLPTMLLSGFIFPIENMPVALQYFSYIVPAKYFLIAIKSVMLKGLGLAFIWKELVILLIMTAAFIGISVKKFKIRLD
jgi:ABC-2 type transport system permease protein